MQLDLGINQAISEIGPFGQGVLGLLIGCVGIGLAYGLNKIDESNDNAYGWTIGILCVIAVIMMGVSYLLLGVYNGWFYSVAILVLIIGGRSLYKTMKEG